MRRIPARPVQVKILHNRRSSLLMDIADWEGRALRLRLLGADGFSEAAIASRRPM
ncbi:MAG TPA: hypothetical protein VGS58_16155 [Candidatus Sulfopaludibacter sp.]|nr:hypothetical protein [Candidatus Sulfopaludibacter sp.]